MDEIERLKKELEEQTRRAEDRLNQLRYLQADFDTFRRRYEKEKEEITSPEGLTQPALIAVPPMSTPSRHARSGAISMRRLLVDQERPRLDGGGPR